MSDTYRGNNDFKKGYQPGASIMKAEKGDLVTDSHSILGSWRKHFSHLFNVQRVNNSKQTETHTAEPLVPKSIA